MPKLPREIGADEENDLVGRASIENCKSKSQQHVRVPLNILCRLMMLLVERNEGFRFLEESSRSLRAEKSTGHGDMFSSLPGGLEGGWQALFVCFM